MVERLLIAQRGEAAARIARTCKRLGITSIAVRDETEPKAVHLEACDELCTVANDERGWPLPDALVQAAEQARADAVHPGYGAPARHLPLARAVHRAGLRFIGPSPEALETLCDRTARHRLGEANDVRVVPASGPVEDLQQAHREAERLDFPVVLKSLVPGTGAPARAAHDERELDAVYEACRAATEARARDPRIVLEHQFHRPRVLELTVVGDRKSGVAALVERERSIWHEGHVLLEEAPSPALTMRRDGESIRDALAVTAMRIVQQTDIADVTSVRFIFDVDNRVWLAGLSSGLPEEHALVEMGTSLDLVEIQLRIEAGEALEEELKPIQPAGHTFMARVRTGHGEAGADEDLVEVHDMRWPPAPHGMVRVEPSVRPGGRVSPAPGTLLVKIATFAPVRHAALLSLDRMLAATQIRPLTTNVPVLRKVLGHEAFRAGQYHTGFLEQTLPKTS